MVKYIVWAILFYFMFRFIFNFILPLIRASRRMREQMGDFQQKMKEQQQFGEHANASFKQPPQNEKKSKSGDYIDFEEVRK